MNILREFPENVFWLPPEVFCEVEEVGDVLKTISRQRGGISVRGCFHENERAAFHQMLILHPDGGYVRPHKHPTTAVVYAVVQGSANIFFFGDKGNVENIVSLSAVKDRLNSKRFLILPKEQFYMPRVQDGPFLFFEINSGPFDSRSTIFADWAPPKDSFEGEIAQFLKKVNSQLPLKR